MAEALEARAAGPQLSPAEATAAIDKLSEQARLTERTLKSYEARFADQREAVTLLHQEIDRLYTKLGALQEQAAEDRPVPVSALDQIAEGIAKVTVLTLVGGLVGGPLLALATQSLLGPKIIEAAVGGFVAGVSNELAERAGAKAPDLVARRNNLIEELAELAEQREFESDDWLDDHESDSADRDDDGDGR